jgi:hypothetical protein
MSFQEVSRSEDVKYGRVTVGLTAVPLSIPITTDQTGRLCRGCLVKAASTNTQPIFVGGPTVSSIDGFPVEPGAALVLPIDRPDRIFVISTDDGQTSAWIGD